MPTLPPVKGTFPPGELHVHDLKGLDAAIGAMWTSASGVYIRDGWVVKETDPKQKSLLNRYIAEKLLEYINAGI